MLAFKTVFALCAILVCFSCFIQASPTAVDREIGQDSLFDNNEGSGELDVFEEAALQPYIDALIEEEKIDENFPNPKIHEEKADVKAENFEDEANEDEEDIKEIKAEIFEDETKEDGDSIEKILIAEIEDDKEPGPLSNLNKHKAVDRYIDGDLGEEGGSDVQQQEAKDDGKKNRKEKKKFGQGYLRHAVDLIGELRKDLRDMIPIKKIPFLPFK